MFGWRRRVFSETTVRNRPLPGMLAGALLALSLALFGASLPGPAGAQEAIVPGEAVVTRFSGTLEQDGRRIIDPDGAVAAILDLTQPGGPPLGAHWFNEFQRKAATAAEIGQVFGVALDDASPPNVYLTATSAFGLHRDAGNADWMAGMWGAEGGPGTVWKLDAANGYQPEVFARIELEGRPNSGAALGNIAFDARNRQLYVSDLETGMIHRLRLSDGADLGTFDHGTQGRGAFFDVPSGQYRTLAPVPFDPASRALVDDCPSGDFARTPSCWNFADFRRRVWGLGVRFDPASEETRLYYATWSSQGFGSPDFAAAGEDEQRNAVWSVAIGPDGDFDPGGVRREFVLPDFFRTPEAIARAGRSHPVADIAFPATGEQDVMLLAERGGVRNLGLAADNAFAYPNEARVLRYELTEAGTWRGAGRYDVGYYDRGEDGPPYMRAGAAGGVSFGPGYGESWDADPGLHDGFVWMTGDNLCSPRGLCFDSSAGEHNDSSQVTGVQGRAARPYDAFEPFSAFQPYPAPGPVTPPGGPDSSFMVDADVNIDAAGNAIDEELQRNDATRVGDIAVFQPLAGEGEETAPPEEPEIAGWPEGLPPEGWLPAPPPDDGWFPPPPFPFNSDLAIRKTGPAQCQEGVECAYTIRIRNLGDLAYIGPLAIEDTMPAGATLASTSPGWNCLPGGVTFRCITNAPALLAPGATAAIDVNLLLPADVPGPTVINCAAIDWFEMGTDDGPDGNDEDCVETPVIAGFDLGIFKTGPVNCTENADCTFFVQVVNFGPGEFNGAISVRDPLPAGTTLVVAGFDPGTVTCSLSGGDVVCQTPDITLPVGGMVPIFLRIKLPDGIAGGTVENCARIDWGLMTSNDGAADIHPDEACYTANVLDGAGFFDLSVAKQGPAHCDAGGNCVYQIAIANNGPDDYNGEIVLRDTTEPGVAYVGANPGWTCVAGPPVDCTLNGGPHTLHPGDTRSLTLTVAIPNPPPAADPMLNCIAVNWGAGGMPADDNPAVGSIEKSDDTCIPTFVNQGFDLEIAKTGPVECYEGGACDFTVSITNNGPAPFVAFMAFDDMLPAGSTLEGVTGAFSCNSAVPGTVTCNNGGMWFMPGMTQDVEIHTRLPDPVIGDTATNCAAMNWGATPPAWYLGATYTGDDNPATDGPACVSVPVLAADLAPWGATSCELGSACAIEVRVENRGGRLFKGAAGLRGTLDPGVAIASIRSPTPALACQVIGIGLYECESPELTIKPGAAAEVQLVLQIPQDFPHRRIVHRKEMIWPDAEVKDARPENDRHTSTIMILQPQEAEETRQPEEPVTPPPPPPPPPSQLAADLAVTKIARQRGCMAGETCEFLVRITNTGRVGYTGPLHISDDIAPSSRLGSFGPRPWRCSAGAGAYACTHPVTTLAPGESRLLSLAFIPGRGRGNSLRNCAALDWSEASRVMAVQRALNELGFAAGSVDGRAGPRTRSAIQEFQESAGLPVNGRIDAALLRRLFVSWGTGDANAANDNSCVAIGVQQPVEPPPVCAGGQTEIPASRVKTLQAQGWRIGRVTSGGQTIFCGTPPAPPACARGQTEIPASRVRTLQAQGWQIERISRGGQTIYCGTPPVELPPLTCPRGYTAYTSRSQIPPNSEVVERVRGNEVLYCARPQPQVDRCPGGWTPVDRNRAKDLARLGWEIQQVGSLLCARQRIRIEPAQPQFPACTGGRVWDTGRNACVCPGNTRWDEKQGRCVAPPVQLQRIVPQPGLRITPAPQ